MRLYHNPRCSKSRQAVSLLNSRGIQFQEYKYLDLGIALDDLETLLQLEGVLRVNDMHPDDNYNLDNESDLRKLLVANPKLLQRPILIHAGKAVIGRPPENILTLLPDA